MLIEINDDVLKSRHGNLVIYDIDYLLKHLDREIELLKKYKQDMPLIDFEQVKKELLSQCNESDIDLLVENTFDIIML